MNLRTALFGAAGAALFLIGFRPALFKRVNRETFIEPGSYAPTVKVVKEVVANAGLKGNFYLGRIKGNGYSDRLHKGGRRLTFVYIPPHFDPSEPYESFVFFHGLGGFFKKGTSTTDSLHYIGNTLQRMDKGGVNYIFVLPEMPWSIYTNTVRGRQHHAFCPRSNGDRCQGSEEENFRVFWSEFKKAFQQRFHVPYDPAVTTFIGHSAGGATLKSVAQSGMFDEIKPEKVVFSDATYGRWLDDYYRYFRDKRNTKTILFNLLDYTETHPYKRTRRFYSDRGGQPSDIQEVIFSQRDGWRHIKIGQNALEMSRQY